MIILILLVLIIYIFYIYFLRNKILQKEIQEINFNSSWCHWSRKMKPLWKELRDKNKFSNIDIIDIKCDLGRNKKLCDKYDIHEYPTIKVITKDKTIDYEGEISYDNIILFIKNSI